jgi:type II secretory ATPase GspE/PulE/Tfp pilus assembly ATPase PilB-like protein
VDEIRAAAASEGMETLKDSGLVAIREGLTTPAEVVRVALDSG